MSDTRSPAVRFAESVLVRAVETLIRRCAPELPMLVHNERLADAQFYTLLESAEQLQFEEPLDAFALEQLSACSAR